MTTIAFMIITATSFQLQLSSTPYFIIGAFLFAISDANLGFSQFTKGYKGIEVSVSVTYYSAQLLITMGALGNI